MCANFGPPSWGTALAWSPGRVSTVRGRSLSGAYQKVYVPLPPNKGMFYDLSITGDAVRVFADDFEVVAKQWASNEAYGVLRPFGQPGTQGARI